MSHFSFEAGIRSTLRYVYYCPSSAVLKEQLISQNDIVSSLPVRTQLVPKSVNWPQVIEYALY